MKPKNTPIIGLDIGSHSVKLVELARAKDKWVLRRVQVLPFPGQTSDNLTPVVKPLAPTLGPEASVRIVLSGSSLLVRCVSMPIMTAQELKSAIRFEAENHIAFPIDDCVLGFQIVNQDADKKTMNVLLVAAKRDFLQERLHALADLEIHPDVVDVDTFCLVNAFEALGEPGDPAAYGLLNIGHHVSSFAIVKEGLTLFVREIPIGGVSVTKALAEAKNFSDEEAEEAKKNREPDALDDLRAATHKGLEPLVDQIKQSIDYFENTAGGALKEIWASGGGMLSVGAAPYLTEGLERTVSLWDSTKKLDVADGIDRALLEQQQPLLNVALGLAVRP